MKKLLLILLCLPMIGFGQTLIPDANFEQALINLGHDALPINGSVPTTNINTIISLNLTNANISNLTGIADFTALDTLWCGFNQLTSLDVTQNTALRVLGCGNNQLASLDVSQNTALTALGCNYNQLTALDVSQNAALTELECNHNQLTYLDVSNNTDLYNLWCRGNQLSTLNLNNNTALIYLYCDENQLTNLNISQCLNLEQLRCEVNKLTSLDLSPNINLGDELYLSNNELTSLNIKNGMNYLITNNQFTITNNPYLTCVEVDDPVYSDATWLNIDPQHYFALSCVSSVDEFENTEKELLKITNVLGKETKQTNQPLFYIYDDGTVEKRIVIE